MKYELQNIISGTGKVKFGKPIQAAASHLKRSSRTGALVENDKQIKRAESESLSVFIEENKLWITKLISGILFQKEPSKEFI
jgi:hypothetical protein